MNKYHSFYSSGGGSISLVDAKSESFFTFVDERSSRLAGGFFVAGGSSATILDCLRCVCIFLLIT